MRGKKSLLVVILASVLALFTSMISSVAQAQTSTIVISNGIKLVAQPDASGAYCTMGPVGTDSAGRKVGITAGHCWGANGSYPGTTTNNEVPVYAASNVAFGPIGYLRWATPAADQAYKDYMVIQFVDNVVLSSQGPKLKITGIVSLGADVGGTDPDPQLNLLGAAFYNNNVLKVAGATTVNTTTGRITNNSNGLYQSWAAHSAGDSGGAAVWGPLDKNPTAANGYTADGKWAAITTRIAFGIPPYVYTSSANILRDLKQRDAASGYNGSVVGAGFATTTNP
ncbi:hypothetical protein I8H83_02385 [Candidatus Saccharibacteria bacterium]|nr:hypothetical protein [Candidatus Saccharibacteria bacterium]